MNTTTSPHEAAREYAAQGYPVLPLHTPVPVSKDFPSGCDCRKVCEDVGKHPRTMHGVKDASTDPVQIDKWWTMWPTANVGIDLAGARLLDIAPDSPEWEANFIARGLPRTLTFASGGGAGHLHFLYRMPEGVPQTRVCRSGEYDILSAGFAVAPPSLHKSGLGYLWVRDDVPLADPPHWACALLAERPKGKRAPVELGEVTRDEAFNLLLESVDMRAWEGTLFDGDRSKGLVAIAGELGKAGCNLATIIHWLGERDDSLGWHKYSDRSDRDVRYEELAAAAVDRAATEPKRVGAATRARVTAPPIDVDDADATYLTPFPEPPMHVLPTLIQDICGASSLPQAMLLGAFGGALATAIGGRAEVVRDPKTWIERAILWLPLIAPPGAGKSPAIKLAYGPLEREDAVRRKAFRDKVKEYMQDLVDCADAKARAQFKLDNDYPIDTSKLYSDTSQEALITALEKQDALGLRYDELKLFLRGLGEYKAQQSTDQGRMLAAWDGAPISYTRRNLGGRSTGATITVERPTLTICGALVMADHHLLGADEDGMRVRWLPHVWGGKSPTERTFPGEDMMARYDELIAALQAREKRPRQWFIVGQTLARWRELEALWPARAVEDGVTPVIANALRKADRQIMRLALVLAEADRLFLPIDDPDLPLDALERAVTWFEWTIECWKTLPSSQAVEFKRGDVIKAQQVLKLITWLDRKDGWVMAREARRSHCTDADTPDQWAAVEQAFKERYPNAWERRTAGAAGGRPSTYLISPRLVGR